MKEPFNYKWDWSLGSAGSYRDGTSGFPEGTYVTDGNGNFIITDDSRYIILG